MASQNVRLPGRQTDRQTDQGMHYTQVMQCPVHRPSLKTNRIQLVLFGEHNRNFGPYLAAMHRIPFPVAVEKGNSQRAAGHSENRQETQRTAGAARRDGQTDAAHRWRGHGVLEAQQRPLRPMVRSSICLRRLRARRALVRAGRRTRLGRHRRPPLKAVQLVLEQVVAAKVKRRHALLPPPAQAVADAPQIHQEAQL
jgi:hypothetical protein